VSAQLTGESVVDVAAAVFNDRGEGVSSLKEQVTATGHRATLTHQFQVKPGLYQVRVSARDATTGKAGSAMDWIEIPNPGSGPFSMSSLVVDREPPRLRFLTYVYNARRSGKRPPDVVLQDRGVPRSSARGRDAGVSAEAGCRRKPGAPSVLRRAQLRGHAGRQL
jgi:hypothetical protein